MAEIQTWACDVCGKMKEPTDHWWVIYFCEQGLTHFAAWPHRNNLYKVLAAAPCIVVAEFQLCGLEHLHRKLSELTKQEQR